MMGITIITAITAVIIIITIIVIRMRRELRLVMIITLLFQICVSGVCGVPGQPVQSHAAVESGSDSDNPWPLLRDPAVRASRPRARAATQDSAQVLLSFISDSHRLQYFACQLESYQQFVGHQNVSLSFVTQTYATI